jgi:hypothetical protein
VYGRGGRGSAGNVAPVGVVSRGRGKKGGGRREGENEEGCAGDREGVKEERG